MGSCVNLVVLETARKMFSFCGMGGQGWCWGWTQGLTHKYQPYLWAIPIGPICYLFNTLTLFFRCLPLLCLLLILLSFGFYLYKNSESNDIPRIVCIKAPSRWDGAVNHRWVWKSQSDHQSLSHFFSRKKKMWLIISILERLYLEWGEF